MAKYKSALQTKWNAESERLVKQIGERAEGYIWMCDRDSTYYSRWSISFTVISAFLALATGTAQIIIPNVYTDVTCAYNSTDCTTDKYPGIVLGVVNYIVAGLITIIKLNNFDAFVDRLKRSSGKFRNLQSDVQQQLSMQRVDRMPAVNYIKAISDQYNKITSNKTFKIRRSTVEKLKKQFSNTGVTLPEIAGDIKEIMVAVPEENENNEEMQTSSAAEQTADEENQLESSSSVTTTGDIDISAPKMPSPETDDSSPPVMVAIPGTSSEAKPPGVSTDTDSPPQYGRKKLTRKKSTKAPKKSTTTYMGLQYHDHRPNMQEINFQLSRFGGS